MATSSTHLLLGVLCALFSLARSAFALGHAGAFGSVNNEEAVPICSELECPSYESIHRGQDFEVRRYKEAGWIQTSPIQEISFTRATELGFEPIFSYIQGGNKKGVRVPMTSPVVTSILPSDGPFCSSAFAVELLIARDYQDTPPDPLPNLKLQRTSLPSRCVLIRRFSGFADDSNIAQEAAHLAASLRGSQWEFAIGDEQSERSSTYSIAQYEDPGAQENRHNEVWVVLDLAKGEVESGCVKSSSARA